MLQNFNDLVSKGRKDADEAKELIPEIKRLIASANNKTDRANEEIGNSEDDVKQAVELADLALKTSKDTTEVSMACSVAVVVVVTGGGVIVAMLL